MKKFFALIAVLIATTAAWAQTTVSTDSELRTAIQTNGAISYRLPPVTASVTLITKSASFSYWA